jgi:hypothetical protein
MCQRCVSANRCRVTTRYPRIVSHSLKSPFLKNNFCLVYQQDRLPVFCIDEDLLKILLPPVVACNSA